MGMSSLRYVKTNRDTRKTPSGLSSNITMQLGAQDALILGEYNVPGVFEGCDSVAKFSIISMVLPVPHILRHVRLPLNN